MKATIEYVERKFNEYNQQMFGGSLPLLPIVMTEAKGFLGVLAHKKRLNADGKEEYYDFRMRINTRVDLPESEVEDTIIHEMIHYYIGYKQIEDVSSHGPVFQTLMNMINEKFGRHITISYKPSSEGDAKQFVDTKEKWHAIAILSLKDGKKGVKVVPKNQPAIIEFYNEALKDPKITEVSLYWHNDPYFNQFPPSGVNKKTKTFRYQIVDEAEFTPHLEGAKRLICENGKLREVR